MKDEAAFSIPLYSVAHQRTRKGKLNFVEQFSVFEKYVTPTLSKLCLSAMHINQHFIIKHEGQTTKLKEKN